MDTYKSTEGILVANADCSTQSQQPGIGAELCNHYNLPYYPYIVYGDPANVQEYQGIVITRLCSNMRRTTLDQQSKEASQR